MMPDIGSVWRHRKGGEYVVTGECRIEATREKAVLYVELGGGDVWARPVTEFMDGRFERIK